MRRLKVVLLVLAAAVIAGACSVSADVHKEKTGYFDTEYHPEQALGEDGAYIDISAVSDGYVAASATSDTRLVFQIKKDDYTYNYIMHSDGTPSVYPLTRGDGSYKFRIMENMADNRYAERFAASCDVVLEDPMEPYLRTSEFVSYTRDSQCVKKSLSITKNARNDLETVKYIYDFICRTITYDYEKVKVLTSDYVPVPDEIMKKGKGICFDYASLAACMLRARGIPTKMVFGYVAPDDLYHAWNLIYLEETGWISVSFEVTANNWTRMDLTFIANGSNDEFIGNGENYTDLHYF